MGGAFTGATLLELLAYVAAILMIARHRKSL